jgi:hypothetical protein
MASSAAISGTDLTLQVRYFPRQPKTPVLPRRPPDSRSTSYPTGRTRWPVQPPVCHHRATTKKNSNVAAPRTQHSCTWSSCQGAAASATLFRLPRQVFCVRGARETARGGGCRATITERASDNKKNNLTSRRCAANTQPYQPLPIVGLMRASTGTSDTS